MREGKVSRGPFAVRVLAFCFSPVRYNPKQECVSLPGYFNDVCGNCRWQDKSAECSRNINNIRENLEKLRADEKRQNEGRTVGGNGRPSRQSVKPQRFGMVEHNKRYGRKSKR